MRAELENADDVSTGKRRINRRNERETESNFGPFIFPAICKHLWPEFTAAELARIGESHPRTAEFWLSGRVEMPPAVVLAVVAEALRRDREKRAAIGRSAPRSRGER